MHKIEDVSEHATAIKINALCVPLSVHVDLLYVQPLQPFSLLDWT